MFCLQATEDEMRLLRIQRKLDDEKGAGLLGLSLQVYKGAGRLWSSLQVHKEQGYWDCRYRYVKGRGYWDCSYRYRKGLGYWDCHYRYVKGRGYREHLCRYIKGRVLYIYYRWFWPKQRCHFRLSNQSWSVQQHVCIKENESATMQMTLHYITPKSYCLNFSPRSRDGF